MTYKESVAIGVSLAALGGVGIGIMWMRKGGDDEPTTVPIEDRPYTTPKPVAARKPVLAPGAFDLAAILGRKRAVAVKALGIAGAPKKRVDFECDRLSMETPESVGIETCYLGGKTLRVAANVASAKDRHAEILWWLSLPEPDERGRIVVGGQDFYVIDLDKHQLAISTQEYTSAKAAREARDKELALKMVDILARQQFAAKLGQALITKMHWEADAVARGPNLQTLRIISVMCDRVGLSIVMDAIGPKIWEAGFKRVECREPYTGDTAYVGGNP